MNTSISDAPPLALRLPLKILSTPRLRRQALHVQLEHQQRQHELAPLHHTSQAH
jgi:hypothetical protein